MERHPEKVREWAVVHGVPVHEAADTIESHELSQEWADDMAADYEDAKYEELEKEELLYSDAVRAVLGRAASSNPSDERRTRLIAADKRLARLQELQAKRDAVDAQLRRSICYYREFSDFPLTLSNIAVAIGSGPSAVRTMYGMSVRNEVSAILGEDPSYRVSAATPSWSPGDHEGLTYLGTNLTDSSPLLLPTGPLAVSATGAYASQALRLLTYQAFDQYAPLLTRRPSELPKAIAEAQERADTTRIHNLSGTAAILDFYASPAFDNDNILTEPGLLWGDVQDGFTGYDGMRYPLNMFLPTLNQDGTTNRTFKGDTRKDALDGLIAILAEIAPSETPYQHVLRVGRVASDAEPPRAMTLVGPFDQVIDDWAQVIPVVEAPRRAKDTNWLLHRPDGTTNRFIMAMPTQEWKLTLNEVLERLRRVESSD